MEETQETKEYRMPLIGDPAPSFKAVTTQGKISFPEDFKGKWVILLVIQLILPQYAPPSL